MRLESRRVCSVPTLEIRGIAAAIAMYAIVVFVRTREIHVKADAGAVLVIIVAIWTTILRSRVGAIDEKRAYHQAQHGELEDKSTNFSRLHFISFH